MYANIEDHRENSRSYYHRHKNDPAFQKHRVDVMREYVRRPLVKERRNQLGALRYTENRKRLDAIKSSPCKDCGNMFSPWVMDFDHRDPSTKRLAIAKSLHRSWRVLEAEIAKCDVVCSNCHRDRTHNPSKTAPETNSGQAKETQTN